MPSFVSPVLVYVVRSYQQCSLLWVFVLIVVTSPSGAIKPHLRALSLLPDRRKVRGGCGWFVRWSLVVHSRLLLAWFGDRLFTVVLISLPVVLCFVSCHLFAADGFLFGWVSDSCCFSCFVCSRIG
jgi:hypothetical protein